MYPLNHPGLIELLTIIHSNIHRLLDSPKSHSTPRLISSRTGFAGKSTFKMANPIDHEAFQAAQALCMLALDARQQMIDGDETEDDCVITYARPVVHRYHPYRRPEPQQAPLTVAVTKRDVVALHRSMNEWAKSMRGNRDNWNVFPLEEHEMHPDAPVPEVRRVVRNGVAVMEKVPLPYAQPSAVHGRVPPPIQQPITACRDNASVRPTPIHRPSPLRQIHSAPPPTPGQQPTPTRHPLPDERPRAIQQPTTDGLPSPMQSPSHTAAEHDAHPADQYSFTALILQALLAAPQGEGRSKRNVVDWLEEEYPEFLEQEANRRLRKCVGQALNQNIHMLERCPAVKGVKRTQYRLLARARETATIIAWKTKSPPGPKQSEFEFQGEPFVNTPYAWKSLVLQALLAAPQGQWMKARELINYLATQYPQFLGSGGKIVYNAANVALKRIGVIVERSTQFRQGSHVFWRLAPGARDEATRLAWPASATHCEPEQTK